MSVYLYRYVYISAYNHVCVSICAHPMFSSHLHCTLLGSVQLLTRQLSLNQVYMYISHTHTAMLLQPNMNLTPASTPHSTHPEAENLQATAHIPPAHYPTLRASTWHCGKACQPPSPCSLACRHQGPGPRLHSRIPGCRGYPSDAGARMQRAWRRIGAPDCVRRPRGACAGRAAMRGGWSSGGGRGCARSAAGAA